MTSQCQPIYYITASVHKVTTKAPGDIKIQTWSILNRYYPLRVHKLSILVSKAQSNHLKPKDYINELILLCPGPLYHLNRL